MMIKFLKKTAINIEGAIDFVRSRFQDIGTGSMSGLVGAVLGGVIGLVAMITAGEINNEKSAFIKENAVYDDTTILTSFPSNCEVKEGLYIARKNQAGLYALYEGGHGYYNAQSLKNTKRFAEDVEECVSQLKENDADVGEFTLYMNKAISQPLRTLDVNDTSKVENFLYLKSGPNERDVSLKAYAEENGFSSRSEALQSIWVDAVQGFKSDEIYGVANDQNVLTLEYKDDYAPVNGKIFGYSVGVMGGLCFLLGTFSRTPNSASRARKEDRDDRRAGIDRKTLDF